MLRPRNIPRRLRAAAAAAAIVVFFLGVDETLLFPLHRHGFAQRPLGLVNALAGLLDMPGVFLLNRGRQFGTHQFTRAMWVVAEALNGVAYFVLFTLLLVVRGKHRRSRAGAALARERATPPGAAPLPSRRDVLGAGVKVAAAGAAAVAGYGLAIEPRAVEFTSRSVPIRDLPAGLQGLRIAQLTDVHLGPWLSLSYVREVVARVNALDVDLIALTGDYVHLSPAYVRPAIEALSAARARVGTVAILGNHDYYQGVEHCRVEMARAGVPLLVNDRMVLTPNRSLAPFGAEGLCIAGVDDLWMGTPRYREALGGLPPRMPCLLLSHNPDVAEEPALLDAGLRVDLMLSGHTHGGQVRVPGLGTPVVPSRYGQKYAAGLVAGPAFPAFVCRGVGVSSLPVRLGVRPEVAVIELTAFA